MHIEQTGLRLWGVRAGHAVVGLLVGLTVLAVLAIVMIYIPVLSWWVPLSPAVATLAVGAGVAVRCPGLRLAAAWSCVPAVCVLVYMVFIGV